MAMFDPLQRVGSAILSATLLCVGCTTTGTRVVSKVDVRRVGSAQRLLVVSRLAAADETWAHAFEKAVQEEVSKADIACAVQTRDPLALHTDRIRYARQIAEFKPDLVLVVEPGDGTIDHRGRSMLRRFEAGVYKHYTERGRRELTWRGTVTVEPAGLFIGPADMSALALDLVIQLTGDGLLPKRKRPPAQPPAF